MRSAFLPERIVVTLKLVLQFSLSVVKNGGHILHRIILNVRLGDCDVVLTEDNIAVTWAGSLNIAVTLAGSLNIVVTWTGSLNIVVTWAGSLNIAVTWAGSLNIAVT